jgi:hypothetical protein
VGTISAGGLYRAPNQVPPADQVRVSARSASGGSGQAVIRILEAPARRSAKAGLVIVRALEDGRRIGRCRARVAARQHMTCAIRLDRLRGHAAFVCRFPRTSGLRLPRVRVSATLYVAGKKSAVRRARVRG